MSELTNRSDGRTDIILETELPRRSFLRLAALGATAAYLAGCDTGEKEPTPERFSDTPSWEQDFTRMPDGPVDPNVWAAKLGPENFDGAGQQIYTDKPTNLAVKNGRLVITAFEQQMSGKPFTSARVTTKESFGFGRLVVRAQMPAGRGPHPAIWMRRTPKPGEGPNEVYGEIDIAEHVGVNGDRIYTNLHTNATRKAGIEGIVTQQDKDGEDVPGVSDRMVEYAVERTADGIAFFIDGRQVGPLYKPEDGSGADKHKWPFAEDDEYSLIINMAIGDRWGGKNGVDTNSDPWQLLVESAKFYPENK